MTLTSTDLPCRPMPQKMRCAGSPTYSACLPGETGSLPARPPILFLRDLLLYLDEAVARLHDAEAEGSHPPRDRETLEPCLLGRRALQLQLLSLPKSNSVLPAPGWLYPIHNKGTGKRHPCLEATFLQKACKLKHLGSGVLSTVPGGPTTSGLPGLHLYP